MKSLSVLAGTTLVAGLLVTGCAVPVQPSGAAATKRVPVAASAVPTQAPGWAPDHLTSWWQTRPEVPEGRTDRFQRSAVPTDSEPTLGHWLFYAIDPPGRRVDIALRFAQALQGHDDFAAGLELAAGVRFDLIALGDPQFHALVADIRAHAGLEAAPPCTSARDLDADSAVVTCGSIPVVVHLSPYDPGVLVSDWTTHDDVLPGPHTHAYTTTDL